MRSWEATDDLQGIMVQVIGRRSRSLLVLCFAFVFDYLGEGSEWVITFLLCNTREVTLSCLTVSARVRPRGLPD